jgi:hypothetical protein
MSEAAAVTARRWSWGDVGIALGVGFAVVLTFTVEWMASAVLKAPSAGSHDWFVLTLFVLPLLISLGAIGVTLARRPLWARLAATISIVLIPAALMFGVLNG